MAPMHIIFHWIAPPIHWAKLNTDGTSKDNPGNSGVGGTLRDNNGDLILAFANYYGCLSSVEAESRALLDGFRLCKARRIDNVQLELESMHIVQMVQSKFSIPWNIRY